MTDNILSLKTHKAKKKTKKVLSDLEAINKVMALAIKALGFYKQYTPVKSALSAVHEQKTMIELYIRRLKNELEEAKK